MRLILLLAIVAIFICWKVTLGRVLTGMRLLKEMKSRPKKLIRLVVEELSISVKAQSAYRQERQVFERVLDTPQLGYLKLNPLYSQ